MRSTRVAPDLSSSIERVSDTVSTAILSGTKVLLSSMPGMTRSQIRRPERIAARDCAFPVAGGEPALALLRTAVGEAVRHYASGGLALQGVVADRGGRAQRRFDIAGFDERRLAGLLEAVVLVFRPYPRQAISL